MECRWPDEGIMWLIWDWNALAPDFGVEPINRSEKNWLLKTNTDTNTRMENFGGVTFSRLLTKTGF